MQAGLLPAVLLLLSLRVGNALASPLLLLQNEVMNRVMELPFLLSQDDLCSGELLKWTPRVNRTCMYSRRPETLMLVLQHWTCWRWMKSPPPTRSTDCQSRPI